MARVSSPLTLVLSVLYNELTIAFVIARRPSILARYALFSSQFLVSWKTTGILTANDTFRDYGIGSGIYAASLFTSIHFFFLVEPLFDGTRHVNDTQDAKDMPFLKRFWWALCLRISIRGVGWSNQLPHVPPTSKQSRWRFVSQTLRDTVNYLLILDIAGTYIIHNPIFSYRAKEALPITSQGIYLQAINVWAWWTNLYASLQMLYSLIAVICVGSGISEPQFWPPMFGKLHDAYTLRRAWGRVWHQILRRFVTSIGKFVVQTFDFSPGTKLSSYTQLYVGFFVSGNVHAWGDRMAGSKFGHSILWFQLQAVAITFEDAVIVLGKRAGFQDHILWRTIGLLWVATWFVLTTPLLTAVITNAAQPLRPTLPFSPLLGMHWWFSTVCLGG
ncbi:membrane bound O-acyl transferase family-domain-containing protein [Desarmillaria tabescens]|uniref:Membrane bound O-acyl transferase family-domain-containing protein n=1 Tax=Armillaria tabescens TaxID=1929756 RepID=A0AA39JNF5_ARMTA|nr:membrane bound O-acyl transferase family-domain-containing protein [Desarmillaria tabescens]KAK0445975.1 membrane bound O-acyl transferase family-domain-containing protein [Desarmillaria tabescens]